MRCPHCDNGVDEGTVHCPTCNKDVQPVPRRPRAAAVTDDLRDALRTIQLHEDLRSSPRQLRSTKRCPFCAEEILAEAIVCKYCRRDIANGPQPPYRAVPGASPMPAVLYFLAAVVGIVLALFLLGSLGPFLVVVISAIWAGIDASDHKLAQYEQSLGGPLAVFFGSLLLWIIVFPWYLAIRSQIRAGVMPARA